MSAASDDELAAAWNSGYWHGTCHDGPLNDAAVEAQNPYRIQGQTPAKLCKVPLKTDDRDALAKEHVTATE